MAGRTKPWFHMPCRFHDDERYLELEHTPALALHRLYRVCDRWGRGPAGKWALAALLRMEPNASAESLESLAELGLVSLFESTEGITCFQLERYDEDCPSNTVRKRKDSDFIPVRASTGKSGQVAASGGESGQVGSGTDRAPAERERERETEREKKRETREEAREGYEPIHPPPLPEEDIPLFPDEPKPVAPYDGADSFAARWGGHDRTAEPLEWMDLKSKGVAEQWCQVFFEKGRGGFTCAQHVARNLDSELRRMSEERSSDLLRLGMERMMKRHKGFANHPQGALRFLDSQISQAAEAVEAKYLDAEDKAMDRHQGMCLRPEEEEMIRRQARLGVVL